MMILNFRATLSHQNSEGGQWTQEIKRDDTEINFKSHALPFRFPRLPGLHVQVAPRSYSRCCQIEALFRLMSSCINWHCYTAYNLLTITFTKFWANNTFYKTQIRMSRFWLWKMLIYAIRHPTDKFSNMIIMIYRKRCCNNCMWMFNF